MNGRTGHDGCGRRDDRTPREHGPRRLLVERRQRVGRADQAGDRRGWAYSEAPLKDASITITTADGKTVVKGKQDATTASGTFGTPAKLPADYRVTVSGGTVGDAVFTGEAGRRRGRVRPDLRSHPGEPGDDPARRVPRQPPGRSRRRRARPRSVVSWRCPTAPT